MNNKTIFLRVLLICAICAGTLFLCFLLGRKPAAGNETAQIEKIPVTESELEDNAANEKTGAEDKATDWKTESKDKTAADGKNRAEGNALAEKETSEKDKVPESDDKGSAPKSKTLKENDVMPVPDTEPQTEAEMLVSKIYASAYISEDGDGLRVGYTQPEIPPEYHLSIKATVYDAKGATLARYVSDGGWINHPENYDACEKQVLETLNVKNLENKKLILMIKIIELSDSSDAEENITVYQMSQDTDGSRTLKTRSYTE